MIHADSTLQVVDSIRHLGAVVPVPLSSYIAHNVCPLSVYSALSAYLAETAKH